MNLLEINFTSYIPTTIFGLVGLISAYLYFYFRNRDNNKVEQLKSVRTTDRARVAEMELNDLGVQIDTSTLTAEQKHDLIIKLLNAKSRKFLTISITSIILAVIVAFLIYSNNQPGQQKDSPKESSSVDSLNDSILPDKSADKVEDGEVDRSSTETVNNSEKSATETFSLRPEKSAETVTHKKESYTITIEPFTDVNPFDMYVDGEFNKRITIYNMLSLDFKIEIGGLKKGNHRIEFKNFKLDRTPNSEVKDVFESKTHNIYIDSDESYQLKLDSRYENNNRVFFTTLTKS